MAMNNVYYRFRHMIGKDVYTQKPARLRMNRLVQPATSKADFELLWPSRPSTGASPASGRTSTR